MQAIRCISWLLALVVVTGCGKNDADADAEKVTLSDASKGASQPPASKIESPPEKVTTPNIPGGSAQQPVGKLAIRPEKITIPDTPDGTAQVIAKMLSDDKPQVLWVALPPSYQIQINELKTMFADKMDKDIWDNTFALLTKLKRVGKEKQDYIQGFGSTEFISVPMAAVFDVWKMYSPLIVELLDIVVASDLRTLEEIKKLDVEIFLGTTGAELAKLARVLSPEAARKFDSLRDAKITLSKIEGDTALLTIEIPGEEAVEHKFVNVEGKWLPEVLVKSFDSRIKDLKEGFADVEKHRFDPDKKSLILAKLSRLSSVLDRMLTAKTQEEFDATVIQFVTLAVDGS